MCNLKMNRWFRCHCLIIWSLCKFITWCLCFSRSEVSGTFTFSQSDLRSPHHASYNWLYFRSWLWNPGVSDEIALWFVTQANKGFHWSARIFTSNGLRRLVITFHKVLFYLDETKQLENQQRSQMVSLVPHTFVTLWVQFELTNSCVDIVLAECWPQANAELLPYNEASYNWLYFNFLIGNVFYIF